MAYPSIEPYETGMLGTGDGNFIYWETCGNPDGLPVLVVHGGPGSGCSARVRRSFNPERHRIILFDQQLHAGSAGLGRRQDLHRDHRATVIWQAGHGGGPRGSS